jgi:hypothetical protein
VRVHVCLRIAVCMALALPLKPARAEEDLEPPGGISISQIEYGPLGTVWISWTNPETYEAVSFTVDGQPADGAADGTQGTARTTPGKHIFGLQGVLGSHASPVVTAEFTLLRDSPVPNPITDLRCEFTWDQGGTLHLTWEPGPDAWVSGRLEILGFKGLVSVEAGAREATILAPGDGPQVAYVMFKDGNNYYSPPYTPLCAERLPTFRRGDCDGNGVVNITDPIFELNHLFRGGPRWLCDDACDSNDDGKTDISDPIVALAYLFQGGTAPPLPGPNECGVDLTGDFLSGLCSCE